MEKFVNNVGAYLVKKEAMKRDDLDVFTYGLDLILFSLLSMIGLLVLGLASGQLTETILCLAVFTPMQTTGGGYHARTHFRCFLTMVSGWLVAMVLCRTLPPWAGMIFAAQGIAAVFMYAPIEHINAPMSTGQKKKMRGYARSFCVAISIIASVLYVTRPTASIAILTGLGMSGISMNVAHHMKKR